MLISCHTSISDMKIKAFLYLRINRVYTLQACEFSILILIILHNGLIDDACKLEAA